MKRAMFSLAVLGFALVFAGCRGITTDLHDIHVITLNPGPAAAVNGHRIVTLETDVRGRLVGLPIPQRVDWIFHCDWMGGYPVWDSANGWWENAHAPTWDPSIDAYVNLRQIHGWWEREKILGEDGEHYAWGDWIPIFHGQDFCEINGCDDFRWRHVPGADTHRFMGWFTSGGFVTGGLPVTERTVFTADTTIFARWYDDGVTQPVAGSVAEQLAELRSLPGTPLVFSITVNANEYIAPQVLDFGGAPITIALTGRLPISTDYWGNEYIGEMYTALSLRAPGAMFTVGPNVTLVLRDVELWGFHRNHTSMIVVEDGGRVVIGGNARLAWNNISSHMFGGAVTVRTGGELVMEGGVIRQNVLRHPRLGANMVAGGAGVWVRGGTFTMLDGIMYENIALGAGGAVRVSHGGTFIMEDGLLYDNASFIGAGVFVGGGSDGEGDPAGDSSTGSTFIMRGGAIEDNFSPLFGAGVSVGLLGRFEMFGGDIVFNEGADGVGVDNEGITILHDGSILFNTSLRGATGGVSNFRHFEMWDGLIGVNEGGFGGGVRNLGDFQMFGGSIQGNIGNGGPAGGVVNIAQFQMHGGEISNNISSVQGGGIVHGLSGNVNSGQFVVTGGMIWNNRDLTTHHESGLPGSMGNIRRSHPNADSFVLARLGFFSLNAADHPGGGWAMTSGPVPVFDGALPAPRPRDHPPASAWQWDSAIQSYKFWGQNERIL